MKILEILQRKKLIEKALILFLVSTLSLLLSQLAQSLSSLLLLEHVSVTRSNRNLAFMRSVSSFAMSSS